MTEALLTKHEPPQVLGRGKGSTFNLPASHKPGMAVPKGGSMCKNCEYLKDAKKKICGEPNFVKWNGSGVIPGEIDAYCSDWYEPKEAVR